MSRASSFDAGRGHWLSRLGNLRNVVWQEMVAQVTCPHLRHTCSTWEPGRGRRVCASHGAGHDMTAVEPDATMRDLLAAAVDAGPFRVRGHVRVVSGRLGPLPAAVTGTAYDVVLCHGVLICTCPRATRPVAELAAACERGGLEPQAWYGVRVATDSVAPDTPVPEHGRSRPRSSTWRSGRAAPTPIAGSPRCCTSWRGALVGRRHRIRTPVPVTGCTATGSLGPCCSPTATSAPRSMPAGSASSPTSRR